MPFLKDFEIYLPTVDKRSRQFQMETRCVTSMYARLFPKFSTPGCWKILLKCVPNISRSQVQNLLGVFELEVEANVEKFFELMDTQKKEWTFEVLQRGINQLLQQTGWSPEPFQETFDKLRSQNLVNQWTWKKRFSPSRKLAAEVRIDHDVASCDIGLRVYDRDQLEIARKTLISALPDEFSYARYLGSLSWDSPTLVVLRDKKGEIVGKINVPPT